MRTSSILALLALSFLATTANANDGDDDDVYFTLGLGGVDTQNVNPPGLNNVQYDTGISYFGAIGVPIGKTGPIRWAIEGEWYNSFSRLDANSKGLFPGTSASAANTSALLVNLAAECPLSTDLKLYVAGGFGYAPTINFDTLDTGNFSQLDDNGTVAQAKVGLRYKLGRNYDFGLGYRYFRSESLSIQNQTTGGTNGINYETQAIEIDFRWGLF